jgi:hypothetical protein
MKLTRKQVEGYCASVSMLTGVDVFVNYRNGYVAIDEYCKDGCGINNLCCGTLRECYSFLKGLAYSQYARK